jgi:hypothetical protein
MFTLMLYFVGFSLLNRNLALVQQERTKLSDKITFTKIAENIHKKFPYYKKEVKKKKIKKLSNLLEKSKITIHPSDLPNYDFYEKHCDEEYSKNSISNYDFYRKYGYKKYYRNNVSSVFQLVKSEPVKFIRRLPLEILERFIPKLNDELLRKPLLPRWFINKPDAVKAYLKELKKRFGSEEAKKIINSRFKVKQQTENNLLGVVSSGALQVFLKRSRNNGGYNKKFLPNLLTRLKSSISILIAHGANPNEYFYRPVQKKYEKYLDHRELKKLLDNDQGVFRWKEPWGVELHYYNGMYPLYHVPDLIFKHEQPLPKTHLLEWLLYSGVHPEIYELIAAYSDSNVCRNLRPFFLFAQIWDQFKRQTSYKLNIPTSIWYASLKERGTIKINDVYQKFLNETQEIKKASVKLNLLPKSSREIDRLINELEKGMELGLWHNTLQRKNILPDVTITYKD